MNPKITNPQTLPDIVVSEPGFTYLYEVKSAAATPVTQQAARGPRREAEPERQADAQAGPPPRTPTQDPTDSGAVSESCAGDLITLGVGLAVAAVVVALLPEEIVVGVLLGAADLVVGDTAAAAAASDRPHHRYHCSDRAKAGPRRPDQQIPQSGLAHAKRKVSGYVRVLARHARRAYFLLF